MYIVNYMIVDPDRFIFVLGDVKIFKTKEEAFKERDQLFWDLIYGGEFGMIGPISNDVTMDHIKYTDNGFEALLDYDDGNAFLKVKVQEISEK